MDSNDENVIYSNPEDSCYCRGKIYGFTDLESNYLSSNDLSLADSYENFIPISTSLDFSCTNGVDEPNQVPKTGCGEYRWYSYTAPSNGIYNFFAPSPIDEEKLYENITIDVFKSIVTGYSTNGLIASNSGGYVNSNGDSQGFYYDYKFEEGETLYFRIRGTNYCSFDSLSLYVTEGVIAGCEHVHSYDESYEPYSDKYHKAICYCGAVKYEPHCFSRTWTSHGKTYGYCEKCGATICLSTGIGFIQA